MKKLFLSLMVVAFTLTTYSCRETNTEVEVQDEPFEEVGEDIEDAADEVGDEIENAAEEIDQEVDVDVDEEM